jgi:hypothetical protein
MNYRSYLTRPATPAAIRIEGGRYSFISPNEETVKPPIKEETVSTMKETKREIPAVKT